MNRPSLTYALAWKEFRQVAPLVLTVLAIGTALSALFVVMPAINNGLNSPSPYTFLAMPMIFATGIGVLLVGNEKDQRSISWLRSLPLPPRTIAWTKLWVACASLLAVWILSIAIQVVLWQLFVGTWSKVLAETRTNDASMLVAYPMTSLFLAITGLALAWRFSSSLNALLMLIPISLGVFGINELGQRLAKHWELGWSEQLNFSAWMYVAVTACVTLLSLAFGWAASQRYLNAFPAPRANGGARSSVPESIADSIDALASPPGSQSTALVWQFATQSRTLLLGIIASLVLAIWPTAWFPYYESRPHGSFEYLGPLGQLMLVVGLTAFCWLGCSVFQGDNIGSRIRFLADRGVSPHRVWWTRHWIPLLIVLGASLFRFGMRTLQSSGIDEDPSLLALDFVKFLAGALAIYLACQWLSQCIKSPIVSSVTAPLFTLTLLGYGVFANEVFEAPLWLFVASMLILAFATWYQMKPWMDRALDWKYYTIHGSFLVVAMLLPLVPGVWTLMTMERMPNAIRAEMIQKANEAAPTPRRTPSTPHFYTNELYSAESIDQVERLMHSNEKFRDEILSSFDNPDQPRISTGLKFRDDVPFLVAELASSRSRLDLEPSDVHRTQYQHLVSGILAIVKELRHYRSMTYQDQSEILEIALLREFRVPTIREDLGDALYSDAIRLLSNNQARDESRRTALAVDWLTGSRTKSIHPGVQLGGYFLESNSDNSAISMARKALFSEHVATTLWSLLRKEPGQEATHERDRLARELKRYYLPSDSHDRFVWVNTNDVFGGPGSHWRGDWELEARALSNRIQDLPPSPPTAKGVSE